MDNKVNSLIIILLGLFVSLISITTTNFNDIIFFIGLMLIIIGGDIKDEIVVLGGKTLFKSNIKPIKDKNI